MQQHLAALQDSGSGSSDKDAPDADNSSSSSSSSSNTDRTLPTGTVAAAIAAAQASTAASIASGVLFQCDQAERKCKLGRLARSPVSITFYVPAPASPSTEGGKEEEEDEEEKEGETTQQPQQPPKKAISREEFVALAQTSPEALITQVSQCPSNAGGIDVLKT